MPVLSSDSKANRANFFFKYRRCSHFLTNFTWFSASFKIQNSANYSSASFLRQFIHYGKGSVLPHPNFKRIKSHSLVSLSNQHTVVIRCFSANFKNKQKISHILLDFRPLSKILNVSFILTDSSTFFLCCQDQTKQPFLWYFISN